MTYDELVNQIRDLGFSDDAEIEDFDEVVPNAINLAIEEINQFAGGVVKTRNIEIGEDDKLILVDMLNYDENYISLTDEVPIVVKRDDKDIFEKFNNFETRNGQQLLYLKVEDVYGTLKIYYKAMHNKFSTSSSNEKIELPNRVLALVPLLSAYYVWLEDDATKAIYYYNRYESLLQQVLQNDSSNKPKIRILEGGI